MTLIIAEQPICSHVPPIQMHIHITVQTCTWDFYLTTIPKHNPTALYNMLLQADYFHITCLISL